MPVRHFARRGDINSGTYTPTITNVANVASSTAVECQWLRVGRVVTVAGQVNIDPTSISTLTSIRISLPVASNFTATNELGGSAISRDATTGQDVGRILADATNNEALLDYIATSTANNAFSFIFAYQIV